MEDTPPIACDSDEERNVRSGIVNALSGSESDTRVNNPTGPSSPLAADGNTKKEAMSKPHREIEPRLRDCMTCRTS